MSRGHGPGQNASSLTVSKVAGDQSLARVAALVNADCSRPEGCWEGLPGHPGVSLTGLRGQRPGQGEMSKA